MRLGLVVVSVCLTAVACSTGGSKPVTSVAAPAAVTTAPPRSTSPTPQVTGATPEVTTAAPEVTASQPMPSPSLTAATSYLPPDFDPTRAAWQDIDEALKKAAVDNEPVLIDFGATWCPNCAQLDQSFQAPQVQRMVKPLHRVRVDTGPREAWTNLDIATAYGLDLYKTGIPGLVLLSPLGKVEATTNDGLFDNDLPNSPSEIIGFLKPHL
ncbi:thioredoxin family protein [Kitasatospora sp. NBC_01266]|uniref:thioredoxin family protein n=1 Tax=Kitasatospora sp. NBC_01266 TaxID=2903572 RepID=UPI002E37EE8B|nr:thioredoxin family protein [Kitasatospora sp. NBC_01266]